VKSAPNGSTSFVIKEGNLVKQDLAKLVKQESTTPSNKKKANAFSLVGGKLAESNAVGKAKAKKKEKTESITDDKKKKKKKKRGNAIP
jgi:hypothetical protein